LNESIGIGLNVLGGLILGNFGSDVLRLLVGQNALFDEDVNQGLIIGRLREREAGEGKTYPGEGGPLGFGV
jgi:hypothetical protein